MQQGEQKLKQDMERAGWTKIRTFPAGYGVYGKDTIEAMGEDATGDISIHVDAGPDGHCEGWQAYRSTHERGVYDASGRIADSRGVPTPEQAVGHWEDLEAAEAAAGLRPVSRL